jgi:transmembrane sensor
MSEVVKLRTRAEIDEEAATWIWRMEGGPTGKADPDGFEAWLRQDPRHRRAVDELSKVWEALDGLAGSQRHADPVASPETGLRQPMTAHEPATPCRPDTLRLRATPGRPLWFAAAAAVLVAAIGAALWLGKAGENQILATAVGQHRNVVLADGTVVSLNTNTIVETNIGRRSREIHLRKGEAHFDVAPDRSRPFLVYAGDAVVRAVGTEFEVRVRTDRHVDVLVTQGRVEVQPDTSDAEPRSPETATVSAAGMHDRNSATRTSVRAVSAGEALSTATTDYPVIPVSPEQLSSEQAWREGAVVFDSEPLAQAIAEIQRYTDSRIVIGDPAIATLPVGGRFETDDLQGFLDGLQAALPVTIRRTADGVVYVDSRR